VDVAIERRSLRLKAPLRTAFGDVRTRELLEVRVSDGELTGVGEAAPLEAYDGVPLDAVREALEACRPLLEGGSPGEREEVIDACWLEAGIAQAVAAIDVALWDLEGRRAGVPVAALLAPEPAAAVPVNATIAAEDRAGTAAAAGAARAAGFRCVKVKLGVGDDAGRLAAVRASAGAGMLIRGDANGAWDVAGAIAALERLAPVGFELVEEPVHGVRELRTVREQVPVPLAMDETAADPGAAASGATDAVCLKIARCGGISGLIATAEAARGAGSFVYVASTLDGPVGIAAALHAAAALGRVPPCGLATLDAFEGVTPLPVRDGAIAPPPGPGLGVA